MTPEEREAKLARYREGHAAIMRLVEGLDAAALDRRQDGEWSVRQVVHHLADTEVFRAARLRQLMTQDDPLITAFDEGLLAERGDYQRPAGASLALFDAMVRWSLELIARMPEEAWANAGIHTEFGRFSMDNWLDRAAAHLPDHAAQIREALGH